MLVEVKEFAIILNRYGINFTDYDEVKFVILIFTVFICTVHVCTINCTMD